MENGPIVRAHSCLRPHSTTPTRAIPREDLPEEIAPVGRDDVDVSGESVSVSWNAAFTASVGSCSFFEHDKASVRRLQVNAVDLGNRLKPRRTLMYKSKKQRTAENSIIYRPLVIGKVA